MVVVALPPLAGLRFAERGALRGTGWPRSEYQRFFSAMGPALVVPPLAQMYSRTLNQMPLRLFGSSREPVA